MLHTLYDGSEVRVMGAKELIKVPVWNGNRIIDGGHVQRIKSSLGSRVQKLDFGYRIVTYDENDAGGNTVTSRYASIFICREVARGIEESRPFVEGLPRGNQGVCGEGLALECQGVGRIWPEYHLCEEGTGENYSEGCLP